jgi:hypothetical protein
VERRAATRAKTITFIIPFFSTAVSLFITFVRIFWENTYNWKDSNRSPPRYRPCTPEHRRHNQRKVYYNLVPKHHYIKEWINPKVALCGTSLFPLNQGGAKDEASTVHTGMFGAGYRLFCVRDAGKC